MTEELQKTIAFLKELGIKPNLASFKNKLVIQKSVYLLEKLGFKTGYHFGMYVRGPYSPDLTKALYEHKRELESLETSYRPTKLELEAIAELKEVFDLDRYAYLEIAATYECLKADYHLSDDDAVRRVKELKPFYTEAEVAVGVSKAKRLFFKPTPDQLQALKEEVAPFQQASIEDLKKVA